MPTKAPIKPAKKTAAKQKKTPSGKKKQAKTIKSLKPSKAPTVAKPALVLPIPAAEEIPAPKKPAKTPRVSKSAASSAELTKLTQKWSALFKKGPENAVPYSISGNFEAKTAIMHKILGWGYVLTNRNDRLEVLFRDGIKFLISNYKRD